MGKYDFILDNMCYSFSRINSFYNCPHGWLLYYIYGEKQITNFFGQFGTFCHLILEKYFKYELEIWDLAEFYKNNYHKYVTESPPRYPKGMDLNYFNRGLTFFDNLSFNREDWEIISIEDSIFIQIGKYKVVIKPDLVLRNKETNEIFVFDYKSSDMSKKKELKKAENQINFYAIGIEEKNNFKVDYGSIWQIRTGEIIDFKITDETKEETKKWFLDSISEIEKEEDFKATPNKYFCQNLCGCREYCKFCPE